MFQGPHKPPFQRQLALKTLDQLQSWELVVNLHHSEAGWNDGKLGSMVRETVPWSILSEASLQLRIKNSNIIKNICLRPFSLPHWKPILLKALHQLKDMFILPFPTLLTPGLNLSDYSPAQVPPQSPCNINYWHRKWKGRKGPLNS